MPPLMMDFPAREFDAFSLQPYGHKDMVESTEFNFYGNRYATGSADGRITVYNRHSKDGAWHLCDIWGAHKGEILEVHWLPPNIYPSFLGSISTDGKFRLWGEDPRIPERDGRRFNSKANRPVFELRSHPRRPFASFSFKHNPKTQHTYLAILSRNAYLEVYENDEPEHMESWSKIDEFTMGEVPTRGQETSFKVRFDPNLEPCYAAIREGVARDALGLILAGMGTARIWRSKTVEHSVSLGSASMKEFYLAAELLDHGGLVRDVAWAKGHIRGYDLCATVSSDGFLRIFHVYTPSKDGKEARSAQHAAMPSTKAVKPSRQAEGTGRPQSGIGASLANAKVNGQRAESEQRKEGEVPHVVKEVARLTDRHAPFWRVRFDADGQLIGVTGDNGAQRFFKRLPDGGWAQSSELAMDRPVEVRTPASYAQQLSQQHRRSMSALRE